MMRLDEETPELRLRDGIASADCLPDPIISDHKV